MGEVSDTRDVYPYGYMYILFGGDTRWSDLDAKYHRRRRKHCWRAKTDKSAYSTYGEQKNGTKGIYPAQYTISLDELPFRLGELDPESEWIVICRSGNRSAVACAYLAKRGFRVHNLRGGILAWNEMAEGGAEE